MTRAEPSEILRLIAADFDRRGWEYDPTIGKLVPDEIERAGYVDAQAIARRLPGSFYHREGTTHEVVQTVIDRTIGHLRPLSTASANRATIVTDNRTYHLNISGDVAGSNINVGATTERHGVRG